MVEQMKCVQKDRIQTLACLSSTCDPLPETQESLRHSGHNHGLYVGSANAMSLC